MVRILLVLSGSDHWTLNDGTHHLTGDWAEEFVVPHRAFRRRGWRGATHGPMEDFSRCAPLGEIITELYDAGRVVTGQNPASSRAATERTLGALQVRT